MSTTLTFVLSSLSVAIGKVIAGLVLLWGAFVFGIYIVGIAFTAFRFGWGLFATGVEGGTKIVDEIEEAGENVSNQAGEVLSRFIGGIFKTLWRWALGFLHALGIFVGLLYKWGPLIFLLILFTLIAAMLTNTPSDTINTADFLVTNGQHVYNFLGAGANEGIDVAEVVVPPYNAVGKFTFAVARLLMIRMVPLISQVDGDPSTNSVAEYLNGAKDVDCRIGSGVENCGSTFADFITGRNVDTQYASGFGDRNSVVKKKHINDPNSGNDVSNNLAERIPEGKGVGDGRYRDVNNRRQLDDEDENEFTIL